LTSLDLRNNNISEWAGDILGAMLSNNTGLQKLDLRWNGLGSEGGEALAKGLARNRTVTEILLSGNKVSDETLRTIEDLLTKNRGGKPSPTKTGGETPQSARPIPPGGELPGLSIPPFPQERGESFTRKVTTTTTTTTSNSNFSPLVSNTTPRDRPDYFLQSPERNEGDNASPETFSPPQGDRSMTGASPASTQRSTSPPKREGSSGGGGGVGTWGSLRTKVKVVGAVTGGLDKWDSSLRDKVIEMSKSLQKEKESYIALEKRYGDEILARSDLELKTHEQEQIIRDLQERLANAEELGEVRLREVERELERQRTLREQAEDALGRLKEKLSKMSNERELERAQYDSQQQNLEKQIRTLTQEVHNLKRQMEERDGAARLREERLMEELRQTDEQRTYAEERCLKMVQQTREEMDAHLLTLKTEYEDRIEELTERLSRSERDRAMLEDKLKQAEQDAGDKVQEVTSSLKMEYDRRISQIEARKEEMRSEMDRLMEDLKAARLKIAQLENDINRLETKLAQQAEEHSDEMTKLINDHASVKKKLSDRNADLEAQLIAKGKEILRLKEDHNRAMQDLQEKAVLALRGEFDKAKRAS